MFEQELIEYFSDIVTPERLTLFNNVIEDRTRYLSVVLEDIYQPHNAAAVLRSCDCFGVQDVHVIENKNKFTISKEVAMGSSKWLNISRYNQSDNNTLEAISHLKKQGYRIVATTPHTNDVDLYDFDVTKGKVAVFFGTELTGLSDIVMNNADEFVRIPMYGFTESFNISVSAALVLQYLSFKIRQLNINYQLTDKEKQNILLEWLRRSVKNSGSIEQYFLDNVYKK